MKKEPDIFDFWEQKFILFTNSSEEWDFENYLPMDNLYPPIGKTIKSYKTFNHEILQLLKNYGVDIQKPDIDSESIFYNDLDIFGSDWVINEGVVSKLQEVTKINQQKIKNLETMISDKKPRKGPKRKLPPKTARAILVGIRMLRISKQDCTPMRKFLAPNAKFEERAKDRGVPIEGIRRRQHPNEGLAKWIEGAQDRCIEAILSWKTNKSVKEIAKDKLARKKVLVSANNRARELLEELNK